MDTLFPFQAMKGNFNTVKARTHQSVLGILYFWDFSFFLYISHFAVHAPYQGKKNEVNYFENKNTKDWNGHKDANYASMVKGLDRSVGAILSKLKETGLEDNTLVIFMSDNGGIDSKITPRGDGTDNSPFLGGKACLNEGGIRVPLIFRWKGKIDAGKWIDVPVDCTDIFPTILDVAGYNSKEIANKQNLDGQSLKMLLVDTKNEQGSYTKHTHYWHYPFNVIYNSPYEPLPLTPHSAIRDGDYKLIFDWYGRLHLYNIQNARWAAGINEIIPIASEQIQTNNFFKMYSFVDLASRITRI